MKNQYLKTILLSFYSAAIYKNALVNWRGYGMRYFLLVNLLVGAIVSANLLLNIRLINPTILAEGAMEFIISEPDLTFDENINRFFNILHQIPEMELENGQVVAKEPQPYFIVDPISGDNLAIIDTSGKHTSLKDSSATLLITKDTIVIRRDNVNNNEESESTILLRDIGKNAKLDEQSLNEAMFIIKQIPPFTMQEGKIITADNATSKIINKEGVELAQIGPDAQLNNNTYEPMLAVNNDTLALKTYFNKDTVYVKIIDITEESMFEFMKIVIAKIKNMIVLGIIFIAFPITIIASFATNSLMLVFYAFIGYGLMKMLTKESIENSQIMRVAAVAITPVLIIRAIVPHIVPSQDIIYFLLSMGYLYYAIKSITTKQA